MKKRKRRKKESRNFLSYELILLVEELVPIIKVNKDKNVVDVDNKEEDKDKGMVGDLMKTTTITTKKRSENSTKDRGQDNSKLRFNKSRML